MRKYTISYGTYVIGDPFFMLSDKNYEEWGRQCFEDGIIEFGFKLQMYVFKTGYGNDLFIDSKGHVFEVNSGAIALVPQSLIDLGKFNKNWKKTWVKRSLIPFSFTYDNGIFTIDDVILDTNKFYKNSNSNNAN